MKEKRGIRGHVFALLLLFFTAAASCGGGGGGDGEGSKKKLSESDARSNRHNPSHDI